MLGSISLPLGIGLLNVFGALAVSGGVPRLVWYAFAATTLYDCGTHITTTFKDLERDEKLGITTTPLQLGIKPALVCAAVSTVLSFVVAVLPHWLEGVSWHYTLWVVLALLATSITRLPLYLNPTEKIWLPRPEGLNGGCHYVLSLSHRCANLPVGFCACDFAIAACDDGFC